MCQYAKNCINFIPNKGKRSNANCRILCTRNPLLDYELPNEFSPIRALTPEEANLEVETSPIRVIREGDGFDEQSIKDMITKVKEDKTIPIGIKRDKIQEILIKKGIIESTGSEDLDTRNLKPSRSVPLKESLVETSKRKEQMDEVAEQVKDHTMESQDVTGWRVPQRKRGKGNR